MAPLNWAALLRMDTLYVIFGSFGFACSVILLAAILQTRSLSRSKEYVLPVVIVVCDILINYSLVETGLSRSYLVVTGQLNDPVREWDCFLHPGPHLLLWMPMVVGVFNALLAIDRIIATTNPSVYFKTKGSFSMALAKWTCIIAGLLILGCIVWTGVYAYNQEAALTVKSCTAKSPGYKATLSANGVLTWPITFVICLTASGLQIGVWFGVKRAKARVAPAANAIHRAQQKRQANVTMLALWLGLYFFFFVTISSGLAAIADLLTATKSTLFNHPDEKYYLYRSKSILLSLHTATNWLFFMWRNPAERALILSWLSCGRVKEYVPSTTAGGATSSMGGGGRLGKTGDEKSG